MRLLGIAAITLLATVGVSTAAKTKRNFHISGGIQYLAQAVKEQSRGRYADAQRLYGKALVQLKEGLAEDPTDIEAYDYLGRAYAEVDSGKQSRSAFEQGIAAASEAGDAALLERLTNNYGYYHLRIARSVISDSLAVTPLVEYADSQYATYKGAGTCVVSGQAFLKTRGGEVKYGAGNTVFLVPATGHTGDWVGRLRLLSEVGDAGSDSDANQLSVEAESVIHRTVADGTGAFSFQGIPEGDYFLACRVAWDVPSVGGRSEQTGGWIISAVSPAKDAETEIVLSR